MNKKIYKLATVISLVSLFLIFLNSSKATPSPELKGIIEFGQTHVIQASESRLAPHLVGERDTLLLFTPNQPLPEDAVFEVIGFNAQGEKLASIRMQPPSRLLENLESQVSGVPLPPYSDQAWSTMLPWHWIRPGLILNLIYTPDTSTDELAQSSTYPVPNIGAPTDYSFNRLKIRAWDGKWYDHSDDFNDTVEASELVRDFYGSIPVSRMTIADYSPMHLDKMLIPTVFGPVLVTSDEEMKYTGRTYYNYVLKRITIDGAMAANAGSGLLPSGLSSIPRGLKTDVGMGMALKADGGYRSMIDEGVYGGWHGWSAIGWNTECGNAFIHETGHAMNLSHFTSGTAGSWGISDEYPKDGVNLPDHPAGFHTLFRKFRTWYQVDSNGPKKDANGELLGKRDPMNGGDSAYRSKYCFPQYTAYHSMRIQQFFESRDVLRKTQEGLALYRWDQNSGRYIKSSKQPDIKPLAAGTHVALVIATIAEDGSLGAILPVITSSHGNLFQNPSPLTPDLNSAYNGSQFFFEVDYGDRTEYVLIGKPVTDKTGVYTVSTNLPLTSEGTTPVSIKLYRANKGYPEINPQDSTLMDQRDIGSVPNTPQAITVGGSYDGQRTVKIKGMCQTNCPNSEHALRVTFTQEQGSTVFLPLFGRQGDRPGQIQWEGKEGETLLSIKTYEEGKTSHLLQAKAVREVVLANGSRLRLPINDATVFPGTLEEALVLWVPQELNNTINANDVSSHLTNYWREVAFSAYNVINGAPVENSAREIEVRVDLWTTTQTTIDLSTGYYLGLGYPELYPDKLSGSTIYYLTNNPQIGPTHQVWMSSPNYALLSIPMAHNSSGETHRVTIRAQRRSHPWSGNWAAMNDSVWVGGSGGNAYTTHLRLGFQVDDNPNLPAGRYQTLPGQELYIEGRAHHAGHKLLGVHLFDISLTKP